MFSVTDGVQLVLAYHLPSLPTKTIYTRKNIFLFAVIHGACFVCLSVQYVDFEDLKGLIYCVLHVIPLFVYPVILSGEYIPGGYPLAGLSVGPYHPVYYP